MKKILTIGALVIVFAAIGTLAYKNNYNTNTNADMGEQIETSDIFVLPDAGEKQDNIKNKTTDLTKNKNTAPENITEINEVTQTKNATQTQNPIIEKTTLDSPEKIISPQIIQNIQANNMTTIKSVRVDLSSFEVGNNYADSIANIIGKIKKNNGNTIYLSPWSDGYANYSSSVAPKNKLGKNNYFEDFVDVAHQNDIKVYAWFVVGKDNFPSWQHPEWYAKTASGNNYDQEDEPGVELPFASLANDNYVNYHLKLVNEVNQLPIDGWVISEPLVGWGDIYDDFYTDFSESAKTKFMAKTNIDPENLINENSVHYYENDQDLYEQWVDFRADTITNFLSRTINTIKTKPSKKITITIFTEPEANGKLKSFDEIKEWLGTNIPAILSLHPDYVEIQSMYYDFEYPQDPSWTSDMLRQFKTQTNNSIPVLVSVQGFDSTKKIKPSDISEALISAINAGAAGTSFYAYHTLNDAKWQAVKEAWQE